MTTFLHQRGYDIIMHCHRSTDDAQQLVATLNQHRQQSVQCVQADLTTMDGLTHIQQSLANQPRLDGVIHNAAVFYPTPMATASMAQWDALFDCNVKAPFFLNQMLAPQLCDSQGCIVNIADIHAEKPLKNYSIYCMTKAALLMQTQSLARELAPTVRVNAVAPGPTLWPDGLENTLNQQQQQDLIERTVLKRLGRPEHIAQAVWHCLTNDYLTGQVINVDGGRSLK